MHYVLNITEIRDYYLLFVSTEFLRVEFDKWSGLKVMMSYSSENI